MKRFFLNGMNRREGERGSCIYSNQKIVNILQAGRYLHIEFPRGNFLTGIKNAGAKAGGGGGGWRSEWLNESERKENT